MQIQRFILKSMAFALINSIILLALLLYFSGENRNTHLDIAESESNLLVTGENQHYDVALLGTSRGRVFSRDTNHQRVEELLNKKVVNLSKGGGGGLMPAKLHLSHFFHRGNSVDQIFYLVDPWVFYSPINNDRNNFFLRDEPFELAIFWQLLVDKYPLKTILAYLQKIAVNDWAEISRYAGAGLTEGTLHHIDSEKIDKARIYYAGRYDPNGFEKYSQFVDTINGMAEEQGATITYIILPLLIENFPGIDRVAEKLQIVAHKNSHVSFLNLSTKMQSPTYYYDHMHFNTRGIDYFTSTFLLPITQNNNTSALSTELRPPPRRAFSRLV
ncbi:hypothetical protein [Desulforhopalus sp. 52FAK]